MIVNCDSCSTSSAWSECTKEVEEDGACCGSERLSAENGSSCVVVGTELSKLKVCMRYRVSQRRLTSAFLIANKITTDGDRTVPVGRLQKKSVIADAFLFFGTTLHVKSFAEPTWSAWSSSSITIAQLLALVAIS